jgi:hypothetical protein
VDGRDPPAGEKRPEDRFVAEPDAHSESERNLQFAARALTGLAAGTAASAALFPLLGPIVAAFLALLGVGLRGIAESSISGEVVLPRGAAPTASDLYRLGRAALARLPWIAPLVVYLVLVLAIDSSAADAKFFDGATEVLAVLFIGFLLEAGAIRVTAGSPVDWTLAFLTVLLVIAGEVYALLALADPTELHANFVAAGLGAGATGIVVAAIAGGRESARRERPSERATE